MVDEVACCGGWGGYIVAGLGPRVGDGVVVWGGLVGVEGAGLSVESLGCEEEGQREERVEEHGVAVVCVLERS